MNPSGLLNFFETIVPITGNSLADTILFFLIEGFALVVAWAVAGFLGDNSDSRKCIHWIVRTAVFLFLTFLFIGIVWLVKLILSIPWWIWIIVAAVVIHIIVGIVLLIKFCKKKKARKNEEKEED